MVLDTGVVVFVIKTSSLYAFLYPSLLRVIRSLSNLKEPPTTIPVYGEDLFSFRLRESVFVHLYVWEPCLSDVVRVSTDTNRIEIR